MIGANSEFERPIVPQGNSWWSAFIEHFVAQGVDQNELNVAVMKLREAQASLTEAIKQRSAPD